eukprot:CAMPEP_0182492922 /NCGR_PEP_ID=MMETSP1321-20130603/1976_1 /TAXON_ID=91990 /ORGANISM="Bolidomonas sp., Strain RCC1657" /LENGTH=280 /DNA_ID=CAMNT_0024695557 /DNA_START=162 /DNA_END=1000 /DNA_ORIENTATION=+
MPFLLGASTLGSSTGSTGTGSSTGSSRKSADNIGVLGTCPICFDPLKNEVVATVCGHVFCWRCLYSWINPINPEQCESSGNPSSGNPSSGNPSSGNTSSTSPSSPQHLVMEPLLEGERTSDSERSDPGQLPVQLPAQLPVQLPVQLPAQLPAQQKLSKSDDSPWDGFFTSVCPVCKAKLSGIKSLVPLYLNSPSSAPPSTLPPSSTPSYLHLRSLHSTTLRQRHNHNTLLRTRSPSLDLNYDHQEGGQSASVTGAMSYFDYLNSTGKDGVSRVLLFLGSL